MYFRTAAYLVVKHHFRVKNFNEIIAYSIKDKELQFLHASGKHKKLSNHRCYQLTFRTFEPVLLSKSFPRKKTFENQSKALFLFLPPLDGIFDRTMCSYAAKEVQLQYRRTMLNCSLFSLSQVFIFNTYIVHIVKSFIAFLIVPVSCHSFKLPYYLQC